MTSTAMGSAMATVATRSSSCSSSTRYFSIRSIGSSRTTAGLTSQRSRLAKGMWNLRARVRVSTSSLMIFISTSSSPSLRPLRFFCSARAASMS